MYSVNLHVIKAFYLIFMPHSIKRLCIYCFHPCYLGTQEGGQHLLTMSWSELLNFKERNF